MVIRSLKREPARSIHRTRALLILAAVSLWGAVIVGRLVQLQVYQHDGLVARTRQNRTQLITIPGLRGDIFARGGETLATSIELRSIYALRGQVTDPGHTAELLAPALRMSVEALRERLIGDDFTYLQRKADPDVTAAVQAVIAEHNLVGIEFLKASKRFYPHQSLAAQVIGAVNMDNQGIFGVERAHEGWIAGQEGKHNAMRDGWKNIIGTRGDILENPTRGDDLVLTVDWALQYAAEEALRTAVQRSEAKGAVAVVVDPKTGAILAMANYPTFDLNDNNRREFVTNQTNRAIATAIEPGSVLKVVTAAAAMHEGVVSEDDIIDCQGGLMRVPGGYIRDWRSGFGKMSLTEVLMNSSNVGTAKVAMRMSREHHHQWLLDFGFARPTGVGLPGEASGYLGRPENWSGRTQQTVAFGQEISATPLQVVAALAAIANGGKLMRPYVIQEVRDRSGAVRTDRALTDGAPVGTATVRHRVLDTDIANRVAAMMEQVVAGGTGNTAQIKGYRIAGKTSTAEKFDNELRTYSGFVAGFGGFLPVSNPEVAIFVAIDEPQRGSVGGHGGRAAAGPAFRSIAEAAIRILRIAPDAIEPPSWVTGDATASKPPTAPLP